MLRRPVCAIEDLPPGSMKLVAAGKFGVGVYNIDGSLYAIANYCSHEGAPLCAGYVGGTTESAPDAPGRGAVCPRRPDRALPVAQLGVRHHYRGRTSPTRTSGSAPMRWTSTDGQVYLTA